jgi:outer membrane protein OmpA-like peptidoglycan-associated protein
MKKYISFFLLFSGYYIHAQPEELVINGDFSKASPVQSDMSFSPPLVIPGQYSITNRAELNNSSFVTPPNHHGNFMVVDAGERDIGKKIWYTRVKVEAGRTYLFSFRASNIHKDFLNPPMLMSTLNDQIFGGIVRLPATHDWVACKAYYKSGDTAGEVTLAVENLMPGVMGNDLALDDFSFKETESSYETKKEIKPVEESENVFSKSPVTGDKLQLGHVYFEQSKYTLLPDSYAELNSLVKYMKKYISVRIRLEGHTDAQGSPEKNQVLSEQRVQSLKKYLVENGIEDTRIECVGYGASKPLNSGVTEALRQLNRRVEVVILSQ